jgi:RNA polymerase sigma-70 factor (ECF subfamily)
MQAVRQGDQQALCDLINQHRHRLEGLARRILNDDAAAEDVVQEALLAIWRQRDRYAPGKPAWPWIARIVRNGCHQRWRQRGGRRQRKQPLDVALEMAEYVTAPAPSPAAHAQQSELICLARQSVESLPPTWREIIHLSVFADMPDGAIADLLGIPPGTVKSRKHRAFAALRENLAKYEGDTE